VRDLDLPADAGPRFPDWLLGRGVHLRSAKPLAVGATLRRQVRWGQLRALGLRLAMVDRGALPLMAQVPLRRGDELRAA
jgi:hypothetical protein